MQNLISEYDLINTTSESLKDIRSIKSTGYNLFNALNTKNYQAFSLIIAMLKSELDKLNNNANQDSSEEEEEDEYYHEEDKKV